jgi:hypothetical protein
MSARRKDPNDIFRLIEGAGIPAAYARSMLPSWWQDARLDSPASLAELRLNLARNLGLDVLGLSSEVPRVTFKLPHVRKFKRSVRYEEAMVMPAAAIAVAAARVAAAACPHPYRQLPDAVGTRQFILDQLGGKYVSLRGVIKACWAHGIPVIHINTLPDGMPRMDGLVLTIEGRPVIVVSKRTGLSAWMSFIVAHEAGHVALGHCEEDQLLLDETLGEASMTGSERDPDERLADDYALRLLGGAVDLGDPLQGIESPSEQASRAMEIQRREAVDAGHVLLTHAYRANDWQRAIAALMSLDQEDRAISDLHEAMHHEIDRARISPAAAEYLDRVTGASLV